MSHPFWCAAKYYQQQLSIVFPFFTPINCCFWKWWQKFSFRLIMFLKRVGNCMLKQLFFFQFQSPTHVIMQEVSSNSTVHQKLWYQRKLCLPGHFDQIVALEFCMVLVSLCVFSKNFAKKPKSLIYILNHKCKCQNKATQPQGNE